MKPIQIGLLVVVGAIGGALVMKVTQRPKAPEVAQIQAPATAAPVQTPAPPPEVPAEAAPPVVPETQKPSPVAVPVKRQASKKIPVVNVRVPMGEAKKSPPPPPSPEPVKREPAPEVAAAPVISPPPERRAPEIATPVPPAPEPHTVTLNAGTLIPVRMLDGLSSERNHPGDGFVVTLD